MRRHQTPVRVTDEATITGADGITRALLHIGGVALASLSTPDQDRHAVLLALLAASLPHKARLSVYIENRPADAGAIIQQLRDQLAPTPYTPELGELGDRLLDRWHDRLTAPDARHVAHLDYWLLISPYPTQDGYPDQSEPARLKQAVDALTRQLVSMGLAPLPVTVDDARAFLARHLTQDGDAYSARRGVEGVHSYTVTSGGKTTYTRTAPDRPQSLVGAQAPGRAAAGDVRDDHRPERHHDRHRGTGRPDAGDGPAYAGLQHRARRLLHAARR